MQMYFQFLGRVAASARRHVVIIAGNHDSPVDEVITLRGSTGEAELIVVAVPCLRDRDIRIVESDESPADKEPKLKEGIAQHYSQVIAAALAARTAEEPGEVPVVMMGHLFTAGGNEGEGVRDPYVVSLAHVHAGIFGEEVDYVALGHLHVPQKVTGKEWLRNS